MLPFSRYAHSNNCVSVSAVHRHTPSERRSCTMAAIPLEEFPSNSPEIQRQKLLIQQCLDRDHVEGEFWYVVVAEWLEQLKRYLGIPSTRKFYHQRTHPGPIVTRRDYAHTVDVVHEDAWRVLVQLYTIAEGHKPMKLVVYNYSRAPEIEHNLNSFKVMLCNSPVEDFQNVRFSKMDKVGHVEWKIREFHQVADSQATRLWAKPDVDGDWKPLFNRDISIGRSLDIDSDFTRPIVALEVRDSDGLWSNSPDDTVTTQDNAIGHLYPYDIFQDITTSWELDIYEQIEGVGKSLVTKLQSSFSTFVNKAKDYIDEREIRVRDRERDVSVRESRLENTKQKLEEKEQRLDAEVEVCKNRIQEYECRKADQEVEYAAKKEELEGILKERIDEVNKEKSNFEKERHSFDIELKRMSELYRVQDGKIKLDIGGHQFTTSLLTLTKDTTSMLAAMFSGRHELKMEHDGSYFIDRDGTYFRYILNYLRDGEIKEGTLPTNENILRELLTEAGFFQLNGLVQFLNSVLYSDGSRIRDSEIDTIV